MRWLQLRSAASGSARQDATVPSPGRRSHKGLALGAGAALCALLFPVLHRPSLRLVWNVSASVPLGLYRIAPGGDLLPRMLVAVRPSPMLTRYMAQRHYVETGALLVKPIAAGPGQRVCRTGMLITIDGVQRAIALNQDRFHRPLPVWSGCRMLDAGTLFLLAPRIKASFDSRYFGPVATSAILGRAVPLWVRS